MAPEGCIGSQGKRQQLLPATPCQGDTDAALTEKTNLNMLELESIVQGMVLGWGKCRCARMRMLSRWSRFIKPFT